MNTIPNEGLIYYRSLLNVERIMPTTPQVLSEILTQKSYDFIKPPELSGGLGRILGVGILLAEGEEHKIQRKNLMPAFSFRHVKDLYPTFWSKSAHLVRNLMDEVGDRGSSSDDPTNSVEISRWCSRATLDIIGIAGLGWNFNALDDPNNELNAMYQKVLQPTKVGQIMAFAGLIVPQKLLQAIPLAHNHNVKHAADGIRRIARDLITNKRKNMQDMEKPQGKDILSVAIGSGYFSDENLVDQLMTFLAAGHETTATGLTWALYLLCKDPESQARLRKEVRSILPSPDSDEQMTVQLLESCTYLQAVCNEVLRLYAPVPMIVRVAARDTTLMGQFIPKGTPVMPPVWAINRSVKLWGPDAGEFNPERWMGSGKAGNGGAESNYALMTFIHGPRSCIGQAFAKAEFACLVAALIGRFEFKLVDEIMKIQIKGGITARPRDGLNVKMKAVAGW